MANALWKTSVLTSSNEKVSGSPAEVVQVRVTGPLEWTLVGVSTVRALTRGRRATRALWTRSGQKQALDDLERPADAHLSLRNIVTGRERGRVYASGGGELKTRVA